MVSFFQKKEVRPKGFTLAEMLVSLTISAVLITGASLFVSRAYSQILSSKYRVVVSSEISALVERMNSVRTSYSRGALAIDATHGFDALIFTNSGSQKGVLVGIADLARPESDGTYRIDAIANFGTYGRKVPFAQELTPSQLASVLSSGTNAYSIPIRHDSVFENLNTKEFSATPYQSGAIFEIDAAYHERFVPDFVGMSESSIDPETVYRFTFDF